MEIITLDFMIVVDTRTVCLATDGGDFTRPADYAGRRAICSAGCRRIRRHQNLWLNHEPARL